MPSRDRVHDRQAILAVEAELSRSIRFWPATGIELRDKTDDGGTVTLDGHACVTGHGYDMYGGVWPGWVEVVEAGAFAKTLREHADVQLLVNHQGMPLARTRSGTLTLVEDDGGLHTSAQLDPTDPDVARLVPKMRRGDIDEMSMAFRVVRERWEDDSGNESDAVDGTVRRILEINLNRGDVSVVNYGANDATAAQLRDIDAALIELRAGQTLTPPRVRALRSVLDSTLTPAPGHEPSASQPTGMPLGLARAIAAQLRLRTRT